MHELFHNVWVVTQSMVPYLGKSRESEPIFLPNVSEVTTIADIYDLANDQHPFPSVIAIKDCRFVAQVTLLEKK